MNLGLKLLDDVLQVTKGEKTLAKSVVDLWQHGDFLYQHCLNVSLMGLAFGKYLGWTKEDLLAFGLAALLHDIGMTTVPPAILYKTEPLLPEEENLIRKHPNRGHGMLKDLPNFRPEVLQVVQQHHENGDGSGYPWGLILKSIHPWARVLRIIDSYESVTAGRPWKKPLSPKEALSAMCNEWQKSQIYDKNSLRSFIKFLVGA